MGGKGKEGRGEGRRGEGKRGNGGKGLPSVPQVPNLPLHHWLNPSF